MNLYLDLFLTFAKVGVMTFGGGYAMLPMLQREIVEHKHWATDEELTDYFAIGQCTPGIIAVNVSTFVGNSLSGVPGAISATLGILFPSVVIITVLASVLLAFSSNPYVINAFAGIRVCVCVLILNAVIKLRKSSVKNAVTFAIFAVVFACSFFFDLSPIIYVISAGVVGIVYMLIASKTADKGKEE